MKQTISIKLPANIVKERAKMLVGIPTTVFHRGSQPHTDRKRASRLGIAKHKSLHYD